MAVFKLTPVAGFDGGNTAVAGHALAELANGDLTGHKTLIDELRGRAGDEQHAVALIRAAQFAVKNSTETTAALYGIIDEATLPESEAAAITGVVQLRPTAGVHERYRSPYLLTWGWKHFPQLFGAITVCLATTGSVEADITRLTDVLNAAAVRATVANRPPGTGLFTLASAADGQPLSDALNRSVFMQGGLAQYATFDAGGVPDAQVDRPLSVLYGTVTPTPEQPIR